MTSVQQPESLRPDPSGEFVNSFRAAAARMEGLDFVNPALSVEAVAFAPWQGHWLGVLITPWFMNLILAPRDTARLVEILRRAHVPVDPPAIPVERWLALMRRDKKVMAGQLRLILLEALGRARIVTDVPEAELVALLG